MIESKRSTLLGTELFRQNLEHEIDQAKEEILIVGSQPIAEYLDEVTQEEGAVVGMPGIASEDDEDGEKDELYDEAVAFVAQSRRASISAVQRRLRIGYNRAARMIETMEEAGVLSPMASNGNREVLIPPPPED